MYHNHHCDVRKRFLLNHYSTVTGCSVTGTSTTVTPTPKLDDICSPETCGDCAGGNVLQKRVAPLRFPEPEYGNWAEPGIYANGISDFMRGEAAIARREGNWVIFSDNLGATSNWILFDQQVESLSVQGLHGCSSVVVVSRRAAWATHFWEGPSFVGLSTKEHQDEYFQESVIEGLKKGDGTEFHELGLEEMRNRDGPQGRLFNDDARPRVYLIVPRARLANNDPNYYDENAGDGTLQHERYTVQMHRTLSDMFGEDNIEIISYSPMRAPPSIPPEMRRDYFRDTNFNTHRGKVLIQYKPAHSCNDKAAWRMWVEGRELGDRHDEWTPYKFQILPPEGNQGRDLIGRQEAGEVCSVHSATHSTSGGPSTSTGTHTSAGTPTSTGRSTSNEGSTSTGKPTSTKEVKPTTTITTEKEQPSPTEKEEEPEPTEAEPPEPAYEKGTCNIHVHEYVGGNDDPTIVAHVVVYDNAGNRLGEEHAVEQAYGDTMTIGGDETGLGYDVKATFLDGRVDSKKKRDKIPPGQWGKPDPLLYQTKDVVFEAGDAKWSTVDQDEDRKKLPRCEVGDWDTVATGNPVEAILDMFGGKTNGEPADGLPMELLIRRQERAMNATSAVTVAYERGPESILPYPAIEIVARRNFAKALIPRFPALQIESRFSALAQLVDLPPGNRNPSQGRGHVDGRAVTWLGRIVKAKVGRSAQYLPPLLVLDIVPVLIPGLELPECVQKVDEALACFSVTPQPPHGAAEEPPEGCDAQDVRISPYGRLRYGGHIVRFIFWRRPVF
ncbi:hypothetical protein DL769_004944 [Monosporascus sp. CRB-8-3]|nr:hypothetical protein DL769_004944 [Monosporascus sp. CRB-8-3]